MTDRYLTDEDYDALSAALKLDPPTPDAPMYYVGGIEGVVESLIRRHRAEAWAEGVLHCEPDGLNTDPNPYRETPPGKLNP